MGITGKNKTHEPESAHSGCGGLRHLQMLLPLFFFASLLLLAACTSIDCPVQNSVYTKYGLYKADGTPDTLRDTLTVYIARQDKTDSVLVNCNVNTTKLDLPISYSAPEDTLYLAMKDTFNVMRFDTIHVAKTNYPHFESVDCNMSFFHDITGVRYSRHVIDSIAINKSSVNYDSSTEHFHVYLKPRR